MKNASTFRLSRGALGAALLLSAALPFACSSPGDKSGSTSSGSTGSGTSAPGSNGASKPLEPITLSGSSVAITPDESGVVVADEDHEALFVMQSDLGSAAKVVALPGPPEQIVAIDGFVFATIRTLPTDASRALHETMRGPIPTSESGHALSATKVTPAVKPHVDTPEAAPSASASASAAPSDSAAPSAAPRPSASAVKPSASAHPSASASAAPSAAAPVKPKRGTPPLAIDPSVVRQSQGGLLIAFRADPAAGLVEVGRIVLAPDAWGLALTPDRKRAIVSSAWSAEVSVVDIGDPAAMKMVSHEKVAREPRGIVVSPDGKTAFVSHLVGTALTRIDDVGGAPKMSPEPLPAALARTVQGTETSASLGYSLTLSPDGKTLYAPRHALGAEGMGTWWGAPSVDALDVASGKPLQPTRQAHSPTATIESANMVPAPMWRAQAGFAPGFVSLVQPRAVVFRKNTSTLLVANEGTDSVAELGTRVPDPAMDLRNVIRLGQEYDVYGAYPARGGAPTGLALLRDDNTLFVWCRSTFDLARVDLPTGKVSWYHVADDGLPVDAAFGRRLFFNAKSRTVSGGLGCAACHPDGREDGYVWRQGQFNESEDRFVARREIVKVNAGRIDSFVTDKATLFARQTPMLAGRVRADGPYGWHGQNKDLLDRLVEGFSLHRGAWDSDGADRSAGQDIAKIDYIADFIRSGLVPPPTLVRDLDVTEKKGKTIYEGSKAGCTTCHLEGGGSDRKVAQLAPLATRSGFDAEPNHAFKVPSLTFLGGTAPYFHDGSAATLEDLIRTNGQRMGDTSQLNADDQTALAAYLRTL